MSVAPNEQSIAFRILTSTAQTLHDGFEAVIASGEWVGCECVEFGAGGFVPFTGLDVGEGIGVGEAGDG